MIKTAGREFARRGESMGKHVGRALLFADKFNKSIVYIVYVREPVKNVLADFAH